MAQQLGGAPDLAVATLPHFQLQQGAVPGLLHNLHQHRPANDAIEGYPPPPAI